MERERKRRNGRTRGDRKENERKDVRKGGRVEEGKDRDWVIRCDSRKEGYIQNQELTESE